jgi:hypothetical protein
MLAEGSLNIAGHHYSGLSSFANSESEYDLKGLFSTFTAEVGIDGEARDATMDFIVLGDGKELWRTNGFKAGSAPTPVQIDVTGLKTLTLQSKTSGRRSRLQADWAHPTLQRKP